MEEPRRRMPLKMRLAEGPFTEAGRVGGKQAGRVTEECGRNCCQKRKGPRMESRSPSVHPAFGGGGVGCGSGLKAPKLSPAQASPWSIGKSDPCGPASWGLLPCMVQTQPLPEETPPHSGTLFAPNLLKTSQVVPIQLVGAHLWEPLSQSSEFPFPLGPW